MTRQRVVIVGAGVAGSIVASRLATNCDVVVLEAGGAGSTATNPREAMARPYDFIAEPYPTGRGRGGGSRINGLVLEHVTQEFWRGLAARHGISIFTDNGAAAIASSYVGEDVGCLGVVDELLLRLHPHAHRVRLATRNGVRLNAWDRVQPSSRVRHGAEVDRVIVRGDKAKSVLLWSGEQIPADQVILCAGTIGSAVVALRSGIGRDGVGRRMLDHPAVVIPIDAPRTEQCPTFAGVLGYERGVLTMSINPAAESSGGLLVGLMQARSIGRVSIDTGRVVVERRLLSDDQDRHELTHAVEHLAGRLGTPIESLDRVLSRVGQGMWHAVGTMRMGSTSDAVTTSDGLVRGTSNVWCMDASVFPEIPPVPIQGPTMVAAQVLADRFVSLLTT